MTAENPIGISTITLARSPQEGQRITTALNILRKEIVQAGRSLPMVAVDGGSDISFLNQVREIPGIDIQTVAEKGLYPQVLTALEKVKNRGAQMILYTESDKILFFREINAFLDESERIIQQDVDVGIVLAARTPETFATYPSTQKTEESKINGLLTQITGLGFDYTYGPRIISVDIIGYLQKLPKDVCWGWLSAAVMIAKKLNKGVYAVTMDFPCPEEDRIETEDDQELRQRQAENHRYAIEATKNL